ncbi:MAG: PIG-L deacetylase family protein [Promethearchaeota archaeon]
MPDELWDTKEELTILVVEAHPDDATLFAGGTIAKLAKMGHRIVNLCTTYGEKGTLDPTMTQEAMIEIEKEESKRAANVLGVKEVLYLGIPDGEVVAHLELRRSYTEVIRQVCPDIVLSFDPHDPYDPHPDHQATGRTIYEACYTSHLHLYFPEQLKKGLNPHIVTKYFGWNSPTPNTFVDIGGTVETKIQALFQYESQMQMLLEETKQRVLLAGLSVPILESMDWKDIYRVWITLSAQKIGKEAGYQYAEAFNGMYFSAAGVISELLNSENK